MPMKGYRWALVAAGGLVAATVAAGSALAGAPSFSSPPPQPAANPPPFLPASPRPQDPPFKATPQGGIPFPTQFDSQPGMRRRSGGPYVSAADVRQKASTFLKCGSVSPLRRCDAVVVKFYDRFEDAANAHIKTGNFASGLASDREVYLVSVKGSLDMTGTFRGASASVNSEPPFVVDHWNYQVDATTGDFVGGGTSGDVLNELG